MRMTNLYKLTVLGILGIAAACSVSPELDREMEQRTKDALELREKAVMPGQPIPDDMVRVKNDIWLGDTSTIEYEGEPVPTYLEAKDGITLISNRPITLYEIGGMISKITSLSVRYAPELEETAISNADSNQPDMETLGQQWTDSTKMIVNYKGPLSGLLDEVANRFGIWWKYEKNEVYFYKYITKTFVLYTLPTTPALGGAVQSGGEESSQDLTTENAWNGSSVWEEVSTTLGNMTTSDGKIAMNPGSGTITLTDTPTVIKRVGQYVNEMNKRMGKQIAISVKVLQVSVSNTDNLGFNLDATIGKYGKLKKAAWSGGTLPTSRNSQLTSSISVGKLDVDAAVSALSQETNAQIVTSGTVTTMNNKAVPLQVTKKERYVSDVSTSYNGDTSDNNTADTETEEFETGFMMSVLPRILDHGRLMMYFNLSLSNADLQTIMIAGDEGEGMKSTGVQSPNITTRGFTQELAMKSGETLVLSGFEQTMDRTDKKGTGTPENMLLGGSSEAERDRQLLVVLLTPIVMESPLDPESRMRD